MKILWTLVTAFVFALAGTAMSFAGDKNDESASSVLESIFGDANVKVDEEEIAKHPLGSEGNPVRCHMPRGEREYLSRLRCENDRPPKYERAGSVGQGPYGRIMDLYSVKCKANTIGATEFNVYMDMYHPDYVETRPIPGFTIVAP